MSPTQPKLDKAKEIVRCVVWIAAFWLLITFVVSIVSDWPDLTSNLDPTMSPALLWLTICFRIGSEIFQLGPALDFNTDEIFAIFFTTVTTLIIVSLTIERAIEIILYYIFSKSKNELIERRDFFIKIKEFIDNNPIIFEKQEPKVDLEKFRQKTNKDPKYSQEEKKISLVSGAQVSYIRENIEAYQEEIKKQIKEIRTLSYAISLSLGFLVSFAGVRIVEPIIDPISFQDLNTTQRSLFYLVDIILTSFLISGGTEQIHRLNQSIFNLFASRLSLQNINLPSLPNIQTPTLGSGDKPRK